MIVIVSYDLARDTVCDALYKMRPNVVICEIALPENGKAAGPRSLTARPKGGLF